MIIALTVGLSALNMSAEENARPQRPRSGPGEGGPDGPHHKMMIPPLIAALDANHDSTISADELANASAALKTLDKNNDGQLTMEEIRPMPPKGAGEHKDGEHKDGPPPRGPRPDGDKNFHPPVPPVLAALDANGDKTISADEIANASAALKKLDKNGDGQLTKEELRPELPPRGDK